MEVVLFFVGLIVLTCFFYGWHNLLPVKRNRGRLKNLRELTREFWLEIAEFTVSVLAAGFLSAIAVWFMSLFL